MPHYQYQATDHQGERFAGELDAANEGEARRILESQGLTISELTSAAAERSAPLSADESQQIVTRLAQLTNGSISLASGLRAAADECGSHRLAGAMHEIANRVEQGQSLDDVLANSANLFPPHIAGLILAAAKSGKLGAALTELLEHQREVRSLRRSIQRGFAYPLFVACLAAFVLLFALFGITDTYMRLFEDFGLQLPLSTRLLLWWRDYGVAIGAGLALAGTVLILLLRLLLPRPSWSRVVACVPIVGPLTYWTALAQWCSLLSVLVKHQIALPEALRLSAAGVDNAYIGQIAKDLAAHTSEGQPLSKLLAAHRPLPVSIVPLVRWGERVGLLHEAFETACELFDRRVKVRALMLQSILPPILFVCVACSVVMVIAALFAPLISMVQMLG